jgi:hypothetical protein
MRNWRNFNKQQMQQRSERKTGGGGGKFPPWEMETLTFDVGETFYLRFLMPESGAPYKRFYHWPQGGFPHSCTLENPAFSEFEVPCVLCDTFPNKEDRGRRSMRTVMEVIDFRYFHIVPHPEKEGKETIVRCEHDDPNPKRNRCNWCAEDNERIAQRHGPTHKVVELTQDQWDQVWGIHVKLQGKCTQIIEDDSGDQKVCDADNYPVAYLCEHCENVLYDEDDIRKTPKKQMEQTVNAKQSCNNCGAHDFVWPILACDNGGRSMTPSEQKHYDSLSPEDRLKFKPEDADHWVSPGSMFSKVLEATITGKEKTIGKNRVTLKNFNFSTGSEWSTLEADLGMYNLADAEVEKLCTPWDLDERYRPEKGVKPGDYPDEKAWAAEVLNAQAESVNVNNPNKPSSGGGSPWGNKSGGGRSFRSR